MRVSDVCGYGAALWQFDQGGAGDEEDAREILCDVSDADWRDG